MIADIYKKGPFQLRDYCTKNVLLVFRSSAWAVGGGAFVPKLDLTQNSGELTDPGCCTGVVVAVLTSRAFRQYSRTSIFFVSKNGLFSFIKSAKWPPKHEIGTLIALK